jgi:hypothetical protein
MVDIPSKVKINMRRVNQKRAFAMMEMAETIARERATQDLVDRARERNMRERENDGGAAERRSGPEVVTASMSRGR